MGQRIQTTQAGVTKTFFYDIHGSVVAEYEATGGTGYGALKRLNISAGRLLAVDEVQPNGTKVTSYRMADRQGSTRVLMDAAGAVTSRHDYLPFGEELGAGTGAPGSPTGMRTAAQGYSVADNVRQRYADTRLDDNTGLDHTRWRKLETRSGRWTTPDPYGKSLRVANPQSFNRYAYVHNDPVNATDRSGLDICYPDPESGQEVCIPTLDAGTVTVNAPRVDEPISIGGMMGGDTGMMLELPAPSPDGTTGGGPTVFPDPPKKTFEPNKVYLCSRSTRFNGVSSIVNLVARHYWLRTDQKEAGLGPAAGGVPGQGDAGPDSPFVSQTSINNHAGEADADEAICDIMEGADPLIVIRELDLGKPMGTFTDRNNCWTFARAVLIKAGWKEPEVPFVPIN